MTPFKGFNLKQFSMWGTTVLLCFTALTERQEKPYRALICLLNITVMAIAAA